jgi:hypothetical protein
MPKSLLVIFFLLLVGCHEEQVSESKDIANNYGSTKAYYYAEDGKVVRLGCASEVINITRANCTKRVDRLHRWGLEDLLRSTFGIQTDKIEEKIAEILVKYSDVDAKIDTLLSVEPDLKPDFGHEMQRLRDLIFDNAAEISALSDQIARIRSALAVDEDPGYRLLLVDLETRLTSLQQERVQLRKSLEEIRRKHFEFNASILNSTTLQRLFNQRRAIVISYESAVRELEEDMRRTMGYNEILKFLDDSSAWEFTSYDTDYTARAAAAIEQVFRNYFQAISDHISPVWDAEANRYVVTVSGVNERLSSFTQRFRSGSTCQGMRFYGKDFSFEVMGSREMTRATYEPDAKPIFEKPIDGKWFVEPICTGSFNKDTDNFYLYRVRS